MKILRDRDFRWLVGLFVAAIFLWLIGLGNLPLRDWDEGYYGTVSRDMFRTGNWLYPTYLGEPFLLKPPLMFWLISLSYSLGGIGEFTTRFPGAFLTACGVPLLYLISKEVFGDRLPAILTASIYLTLLPVVRHGRLAMLDGMVITFLLLSLWCLLAARRHRFFAIGIGIGLGAIALTKGVLVVALAAILGVFILVDRQEKILINSYFWGGIIVGFLPVIGWYLAQIHRYGDTFIVAHFQAQSFDRFATAIEGHQQPFWYYFIELIKYSAPWLFFIPSGLYLAWQERRKTWASLALSGAIVYFVTISVMGTKLPWYIMPLYPFVALLVAAYLTKVWRLGFTNSLIWVVLFSFLGIVALGGSAYFITADPQPVLIMMAIVLGITLMLVAVKIKQNQTIFIPILCVGLYVTLGLFVISQSWIWELNEAFAVKPVAALIRDRTPSNTVVYTSFSYGRPSLDFYSDRKVIATDIAELKERMANKAYLLLDEQTLVRFPSSEYIALGKAEAFTLITAR